MRPPARDPIPIARPQIPILDDTWRWAALLLSTLPLLLAATVLTGNASPAACALFVILQALWRLSYYPCLLFLSDPVASTFVRVLLLPPIELTLLLIASNRLRRHPRVTRLQDWAVSHRCWDAHSWARASDARLRSDDPRWLVHGDESLGDRRVVRTIKPRMA